MKYIYKCEVCNLPFKSPQALYGHMRIHGFSSGRITHSKCSCIITKKEIRTQYLEEFQRKLIKCRNCPNAILPNKKFCSSSCSASYNNKIRNTTKNKKTLIPCNICANSIESSVHTNKQSFKCESCKGIKEHVGEHNKLFCNTCQHCFTKFTSRVRRKYCREHRLLYAESSKSGYRFTFNVFNYPDLFDLELVKQHGFYQPNQFNNKEVNKNGVSRDHKVSVNDAIKYRYDPYYISHPLNCEIMLHSQNNKKKTKSSITYEELKYLVDQYDLKQLYKPMT